MAAAAASESGLLEALRCALTTLRDRWVVGGGRLHVPPVTKPFITDPIPHLHHHVEVFLQISGEGDMELVGPWFRYRPGDVIVVPRGVAHMEHPVAHAGPFWNFVLTFADRHLGFHMAGGDVFGGGRIRGRLMVPTNEGGRLASYLQELVTAVEVGHAPDHPLVRGLMLTFLSLSVEALATGTLSSDRDDRFVSQVRLLITQYISDRRLAVAWLAEQVHCSSDHLSRRFKAATGLTVVQNITSERLALARGLLANPALNIAEVGRACGIHDPAYFSRIFAAEFGSSPRAWRYARGS